MTPEQITVTVSDPMLAAVLRLASANGIVVTGATIDRLEDGATGLVISAKIDPRPVAAEPPAPLQLDREAFLAMGAAMPSPEARGLDVAPAERDAVWLPNDRDGGATAVAVREEPKTESDLQLEIVAKLEADPKLSDVARHMLRPLASRGWEIPGDREATFRRIAADVHGYSDRHLVAAANILAKGKHSKFPVPLEIFAAIGRAARPAATGRIATLDEAA